MKFIKIFIGVISISSMLLSCKTDDESNQVYNYSYSKIISNLDQRTSCVCFVNEQVGFTATANSQSMYKTIDGGKSWLIVNVNDCPINTIFFINENVGFAAGGVSGSNIGSAFPGSMIYKTTDGGESWQKQRISTNYSEQFSLYFVNDSVGFTVGLGYQAKTTNGGKSWIPFEFNFNGQMTKILFTDSNTGFVVGLFGNIFKSTDQGSIWNKMENKSIGHIYDLCFANKKIGYACGQGEIVKTIDGGNTWTTLTNSPSEMYFIHFVDENNGIAIGRGHYTGGDFGIWTNAIYKTTDGGKTWQMEDNVDFGAVASFPTSEIGYSIVPNSTVKIEFKKN